MKSTFYSYSFGCRVNQAEKEALDRELIELGYSFTATQPNIYIINTCSVTNKAEREARQLIYQVRKSLPDTKIIVTGCAATNWIKTKAEVPGIDLLVDNQSKQYIATIISKRLQNETTGSQPQKVIVKDKYLASKRVIIKIQDGCQRFCTYCIVPYLRGLPKSTPIQTIVKSINELPNIREVILTAINTEAYGYDTKESFIDLLTNVISNTTTDRLSFGSIHPWSINDNFFNFYRSFLAQKKLVNFFHIPLQSGSNKMLQLMKRGYTREEFLEKLHILNTIEPFTFIGTDIIVGFLEETDKDFEDTYSFLEKTPINKFHIFRFSIRQHTAAHYLSKRLTEPNPETKQKRAKALAELNKRKYTKFLLTHVGHTFDSLFLERRTDNLQSGLLSNQIPVKVFTNKDLKGEIKKVQIQDCKNGQLFGRIV